MLKRPLPKRVGLDWFKLTCGHHITISPSVTPPAVGDEYWCPRHYSLSTVMKKLSRAQQYIAHCDSCRFSRNYGAAKLTAGLAATKHAQRHPGHSVTVLDGNGKVMQTSKHRPPAETLDF